MKYKKTFYLLFFLISINNGFCQMREATIQFNDYTTISGYGEIKKNEILFQLELKDEISQWNYESIKGITFSGYGFAERFEYVKLKENAPPILLEVIEEGIVNLYRKIKLTRNFLVNPFSDQGIENMATNKSMSDETIQTDYFVKRNSEKYATNISSNFNKSAPIYFADCQSILDRIRNKKLSKKNIPDVIFDYNNYCEKENAQ
ncbi:hypothetical protein [Flavobacterium sp. CECT 9288]|uniref:hypothetical protein n=1 Tax=Flavobacterium sp. CECT 9288 TaxID=2845819 RepID=UPI001E453F76|nr:hypothetical protein [Flavobacterium sp. CECT 9288]